MSAYPSLKRWLAAGLTCLVLGTAIGFWLTRPAGLPGPIDLPAAGAQPPKGNALEWTMYGGTPSRNMASASAKGLLANWDVEAKKGILWVADLGSKAYGGPTIADGRVFVGTNNQAPREKKWDFIDPKTGKLVDLGVVMCFAEKGGAFQWQHVFEKLPGGQVIDWPYEGICSSPTLEGSRAYFISNRCEVVCVNVKTGALDPTFAKEGKLDMIKELGVFPHNLSDCSPLLVGDSLWIVTSNGVNEDHINVPAPKAPSFIKLDKKTGKVLWQDNTPTAALLVAQKGKLAQADFFKQLVNRGELIQHGQWANPAYAVTKAGVKQVIFPGGDGWIYAFAPDAKTGDAPIWKFDCNPKDAKYALKVGARSDFIATPVIYNDRVYIGIGQDPEHRTGVGHLWCIDMNKKGDVSPELVTDNSVFPPATKPNPNSAMVWHYGGEIKNNPALVKKLKRNYYFGRTMSTCAIHEDILYVAELAGVLHCIDANTGQVHWEHDTEADIWSSPYYADGKVYLGTDDGAVFVFAHGQNKKLLATNDMGGRVRATPVAANGILYVMTENKLFAIK